MVTSYERGVAEGLKIAACLCDDTAGLLDTVTTECEAGGDRALSEVTGVGATFVRHAAARIRAALSNRLPIVPIEDIVRALEQQRSR